MKSKRKLPAVALTILALLGLPGLAQDQPELKWIKNPANGHYYLLLPNTNWKTAQRWADSVSGYLVCINDKQEQEWVFETFGKGGKQRLLWIGLTNWNNGGQFAWEDGSPLDYTNWFPGEPNSVGNTENFVAMYYANFNTPGSWNDWDDRLTDPIGIPFHGVVEVEPPRAVAQR